MTRCTRAALAALAAAATLAAPTAAPAQVPGANGLLAYMAGDFTIHTLDPATGADVALTAGTEDFSPRWSPDGGRIAFQRTPPGGVEQLWVMNADGSAPVLLAPSFTWASPAAWKPDGTALLVAGRRGGLDGLWRISPDGSGAVLLVPGQIGLPAWSPDGTRIAYSRVPAGQDDDVRIDLWVADADGTHRHRLTTGGYDIGADWAPDGSRIAFRARHAGVFCDAAPGSVVEEVRSIRPDGSDLRTLSGPCEAGLPTYAPAGGRVAFNMLDPTLPATGRFDVWTAPALGGAATCLTCALPGGPTYASLSWQPRPAGAIGRVRAGTGRADRLGGGRGPDVVAGKAGADVLRGRAGNDIVLGGPGVDDVAGGGGRDFLAGGPGPDVLRARDGRRDVVVGGPGRDLAIVDAFDVVRGVERVRRG